MKRSQRFRPAPLMEILETRRLLSAAVGAALSPTPSIVDGLIHTTARLSVARDSMAEATVGNLVLFAGGQTYPHGTNAGGETSSRVDIYNAATGRWSTANLSQARFDINVAVVGHTAIFAGGNTSTRAGDVLTSDVVDIYDADTGRWSTARLSQARNDIAVATVGNLAIFAGGDLYPTVTAYNNVDIYNADTGQWSTATLPQAQGGLAATTVGKLAMFAGGFSDLVDIYNATTNQWSTANLNAPPNPAGMAATTVSNLAMFAGGNTGGG